ncbi:MAG: hypothetical protein N3H32_06275, partial [Nitrososphaeria archaeon]|nr:hypothetical protein [Nitrososphaeria archaeon]
RVALLRLRRARAVYVHEKTSRGWVYRLAETNVYVLSVAEPRQNTAAEVHPAGKNLRRGGDAEHHGHAEPCPTLWMRV